MHEKYGGIFRNVFISNKYLVCLFLAKCRINGNLYPCLIKTFAILLDKLNCGLTQG